MKTKTNTPSIVPLKSLLRCALLLFVLIGTGCDSAMDDADLRDLAGVWEGSITHTNPDLNGTLRLTITQAGDALAGTATWRWMNRGISGNLLGQAADAGSITYTLDFGRDGTYLHEVALRGDELTGEWVSIRSNAINGTIALQRR